MLVQLNTRVSDTTKERLENESRATRIKKEAIVEEALLHHFQVLNELPQELIIHPRVVIRADVAETLLERAENPQPTQALKDLMQDYAV